MSIMTSVLALAVVACAALRATQAGRVATGRSHTTQRDAFWLYVESAVMSAALVVLLVALHGGGS